MIRFITIFLFFSFISVHANIVIEQKNISLGEALKASSHDLKLQISNNLNIDKNNQIIPHKLSGNGLDIIKKLAQIYSLDWFIYGGTITIESGVSYSNQPYKPKYLTTSSLLNKINEYFKTSEKSRIISDNKGKYLLLSGTPNLINSIISFSEMIDNNDFIENKNNLEVARLKFTYISVSSRDIQSYRNSMVFPGAAELIGNAINNIGQFKNISDSEAIDKTYKIKLQSPDNNNQPNSKVQILPGTNSILIRATPQEIKLAKKISKLIDNKRHQILFTLKVYDVAEKENKQRYPLNTIKNLISFTTKSSFSSTLNFLDTFKDLSKNGLVKNIYSTNLLVLENQEGSFGKQDVANIQLVSKNTTSLKQVTADNSVYITGRLLPSGMVQANINYVDSSLGENVQNNNAVPSVKSQKLSSEIYIKPNQTIILGGFENTKFNSSSQSVPFLSKIPIIGFLFKKSTIIKSKLKRYISISFTVLH